MNLWPRDLTRSPVESGMRASDDRASLFRRFGAYALGIAIGLMFLGLIQSQRAAYRARLQQEQRPDGPTPPSEGATDRGNDAGADEDPASSSG